MSERPPAPSARCLTDADIAALQAAAPGRAPASLALHLASCERCQQRALFGEGKRRGGPRRAPPDPPTVRRALVLALLALAAMAAFFWSLRQMAGQIR
jgi:hypothetical protein